MKSLSQIIRNMKKYRNKPEKEPLSKIEGLLCCISYFNEDGNFHYIADCLMKMKEKDK